MFYIDVQNLHKRKSRRILFFKMDFNYYFDNIFDYNNYHNSIVNNP